MSLKRQSSLESKVMMLAIALQLGELSDDAGMVADDPGTLS